MKDGRGPLLVVDDEELNRDLLERRLTRAGFEVEQAESGTAALHKLAERRYELVLLDNMMPGMSGVELLRLLRGTYTASELPVIMVTALKESEKIVEALSLGANDYVTKPIDFPVALARIRTQLNQKWAQEALRETQERYTLAVEGANDGLWDWDFRTERVYYSPRWKEMLGYGGVEISEHPEEWLSLVHPEDQDRLRLDLEGVRRNEGPVDFLREHRMLHKDGTWRWMLARGRVLRDEAGTAVRMAGSQTDVTRNKTFDALTGMPNRILFQEQLEAALDRLQREGRAFSVFFLDLDRFKTVNDSLGHGAGDQLLMSVARRIEEAMKSLSPCNVTARMGGDEFAILLPGVGSESQARAIARGLREQFREPVEVEGRRTYASASIGIVVADEGYRDASEILRDADTAMYRAKGQKAGSECVFHREMLEQARRRLEMEMALAGALERGEFELYFQPKLKLDSGEVVGFEALLRWHHPQQGLLSPGAFIGLAEETGLVVPIGMWTIEEACRAIGKFQEVQQLPKVQQSLEGQQRPVKVSVNLSVRQFREPELAARIGEVLAEKGVRPESLELELTETILAEDAEEALRVLEGLKALGVSLQIDDFGTGYSSLSYLATLPFDTVKIDRAFVSKMTAEPTALGVVKAVLSLAAGLGRDVVAEGVETKEQREQLLALGCRYAQGHLFSRAVPFEEAAQFLTARVKV